MQLFPKLHSNPCDWLDHISYRQLVVTVVAGITIWDLLVSRRFVPLTSQIW